MTVVDESESLSPNNAMDAFMKALLPSFDEQSQRRLVKSVREARDAAVKHGDENTDAAARHKFREFIPGYVLNQLGFVFEYDVKVDGKTPDWVDSTSRLIVESRTFERGGTSPFRTRVFSGVDEKCAKYKAIADANDYQIVVSVYIDFMTCVLLEECHEMRGHFSSLFSTFHRLAGILFYTEDSNGIPIYNQRYGFLCLSAFDRLAKYPKWSVPTCDVNN